ncbi:PREDICTED: uncharacterized protein LOC106749235 isoform X2 [Dinoponera quadriceps]|uniref:Uncharacterized protein LOC106749235 isoform X2 n=1 Tax=Dinoponera quadriceps TaxID=609295 RepID=A0A6P3Y0Z3_DINQU|nr:PREDICTED: uncharacterized protein LOC106749235 isoform X2 [Dinoponera quadriceps]
MESMINNNGIKKEQLRCFVCEADVQGRYYYLAACKTQSSRSKVIEKLGELVGERYMVVISEDDVICRSCANHINTLDRLETETRNVRDHILRFLERKYSLEEGELLGNSDKPRPSQPPQITKSTSVEIVGSCINRSRVDAKIYNRNQQQPKHSRSHLQCDKCKYTTHLNSFMMYHIRDHLKQKKIRDKYGMRVPKGQERMLHNCRTVVEEESGRSYEKDNFKIIGDNSMDLLLFPKITRQILPAQTSSPLIGAPSCEYISNILLSGDNLPTSSKQ